MSYYVVKSGFIPGIYKTWDECKKQVNGFSGAKYKKFDKREDAISFIGKPHSCETDKTILNTNDTIYLYVDGSYNVEERKVGSGCLIFINNKEVEVKYCSKKNEEILNKRNEAGELIATLLGLKFIYKNIDKINKEINKIIVRHDYVGICNYVDRSWTSRSILTDYYVKGIDEYKKKLLHYNIEIKFEHIKSHTGEECNERVDKLAKEASYMDYGELTEK